MKPIVKAIVKSLAAVKMLDSPVSIVVAGSQGIDPLVTRAALEPLAADTRIELVSDARGCIALCRGGRIDLVVAECGPGAPCDAVLEALGGEVPVVAICPANDAETALAAFRRGAADCVALDAGYAQALADVAAEQIRRGRRLRERGAAERRLRALERYNENIIHNLNSALLVLDREGCINYCNPPAERILGAAVHDLFGRSVWEWFDRDASAGQPLARTLAEGTRFQGAESALTRSDGTRVPVGISCSPLMDSDGARLGALAVFQDLSEVKQLQRHVLQTEKMASIGQLAAGVAHEINNPMGFIHANLFQLEEYVADLRRVWTQVEALQKALVAGDVDDVARAAQSLAATSDEVDVSFVLSDLAKAVRESQEGAERIRHIVQDLRDFSRRDSGERAPADVNQCLDSTANIVWPMMKHLVVLEKEYADLPLVRCYEMQLKQVFMNLLVNAYQSIEQRVGDRGGSGVVRLTTRAVPDGVCVSVRDDGVGIERADIDRIFDPFFTTKPVGSGTGLGLSTSYSIVQRHGGRIDVRARPGEGATFEVFLPLDSGEPERGD